MMNNKRNERLMNIIRKEAKRAAKELGLKKMPIVNAVDNAPYMMSTDYKYYTAMFSDVITKTESKYNLDVCLPKVNRMRLQVYLLTLSHKAMDDVTRIIVRHECRHMWQYENGFKVGDYAGGSVNDAFNTFMYGYGASREEKDANDYCIDTASNIKEFAMANFSKMTQSEDAIEFDAEGFNLYMYHVASAYNRPWSFVIRLICTSNVLMIKLSKLIYSIGKEVN